MERNPEKKRTSRSVVLLVAILVVAGVLAAAYLYPKVLPSAKLAGLVGSKPGTPTQEHQAAAPGKPSKERKILYWQDAMNPAYKSKKPGKAPDGMDLVPIYADEGPSPERKILYWQDAMNPAYKSNKPGKAPDGMDLVPVYADEGPSPEGLPPGTVRISPERQQLIGVQYGQVVRQALSQTIRAVGKVTYDETRITRVQTKVSGWIDKVHVDFTGRLVRKGQPLISIYSPDLVSTQQEFLIASRAKETLGHASVKEIAASAASLYESARQRLRLWDITEEQIQELEQRGTPTKTLTLYAPMSGFVLTRNAFPGQRVTPEVELYTVADLSTIWVLADVYEYEVPLIKLGQTATMTLTYDPGKKFTGRVTYIYPQLDNATRTLKVRLELPNPGLQLKPDMYANVDLRIEYGERLAVPQDAVLDSGSEQVVFVAREDGYFEPRKVRLAQKVGASFIVLDGLRAGEQVVTSANFLIDSESQLKAALGAMAGGHAGHGGGAPAGGAEKPPSPEPKPAQPGSQTDHSQHQMPGMDQGQAGPQEPGASTPSDHSGHEPKP